MNKQTKAKLKFLLLCVLISLVSAVIPFKLTLADDGTGPVVNFTTPTNLSYEKGNLTVKAEVYDASTLDDVIFNYQNLSDSAWGTNVTMLVWNYTFDGYNDTIDSCDADPTADVLGDVYVPAVINITCYNNGTIDSDPVGTVAACDWGVASSATAIDGDYFSQWGGGVDGDCIGADTNCTIYLNVSQLPEGEYNVWAYTWGRLNHTRDGYVTNYSHWSNVLDWLQIGTFNRSATDTFYDVWFPSQYNWNRNMDAFLFELTTPAVGQSYNYTYTWNMTQTLVTGTYDLVIYANDTDGNAGINSSIQIVGNSFRPASLQIDVPSDSGTSGPLLDIFATVAHEESDLRSVQVNISNSSWTSGLQWMQGVNETLAASNFSHTLMGYFIDDGNLIYDGSNFVTPFFDSNFIANRVHDDGLWGIDFNPAVPSLYGTADVVSGVGVVCFRGNLENCSSTASVTYKFREPYCDVWLKNAAANHLYHLNVSTDNISFINDSSWATADTWYQAFTNESLTDNGDGTYNLTLYYKRNDIQYYDSIMSSVHTYVGGVKCVPTQSAYTNFTLLDYSMSALADGSYDITLNVTDRFFNSNTSTSISFTLDSVAPVVVINEPLSTNISGTQEINVTITSDGVSNITDVIAYWEDTSDNSNSTSVTMIGNDSYFALNNITTGKLDDPTQNVEHWLSPSSWTWNYGVTTASDSGDNLFELSTGSTEAYNDSYLTCAASATENCTASITLSSSQYSVPVYIQVHGYWANNYRECNFSFDNVTWAGTDSDLGCSGWGWCNLSSSLGSTTGNTLYVKSVDLVSDSCQFGGLHIESLDDNHYVNFDTTTVSDGDYRVWIETDDSTSNTNYTNVLITIDNSAPSINVSAPATNDTLTSGTETIDVLVADDNVSPDYVFFSWLNLSDSSIGANQTMTIQNETAVTSTRTGATTGIFTVDGRAVYEPDEARVWYEYGIVTTDAVDDMWDCGGWHFNRAGAIGGIECNCYRPTEENCTGAMTVQFRTPVCDLMMYSDGYAAVPGLSRINLSFDNVTWQWNDVWTAVDTWIYVLNDSSGTDNGDGWYNYTIYFKDRFDRSENYFAFGGLKCVPNGTAGIYSYDFDTTTVLDDNYALQIYANDTLGNTGLNNTWYLATDNTGPVFNFTGVTNNSVVTDTVNINGLSWDANHTSTVQFNYLNVSDSTWGTNTSLTGNPRLYIFELDEDCAAADCSDYLTLAAPAYGANISGATGYVNDNQTAIITVGWGWVADGDIWWLMRAADDHENLTDAVFNLSLGVQYNGNWILDIKGYHPTYGTNNEDWFKQDADYTSKTGYIRMTSLGSGGTWSSVNLPVTVASGNLSNFHWRVNGSCQTTSCDYNHGLDQIRLNESVTTYTNWTSTWDTTAVADGSYIIALYPEDTLSNVGINNTLYLTVDNTDPVITLDSPGNNTVFTPGTTIFNLTITDDNIDTVLYTNDSYVTNYTAGCTGSYCNITTSGWGNINTWLKVWVNDSAGNTNSSDFYFIGDTTPPVVSIVFPANTSYEHTRDDQFTLLFTYVEENPDTCFYQVNSTGANTTMAACDNTTTFGVGYTAGQKWITLWMNDTAGNEGTDTVYFQYKYVGPGTSVSGGGGDSVASCRIETGVDYVINCPETAEINKYLICNITLIDTCGVARYTVLYGNFSDSGDNRIGDQFDSVFYLVPYLNSTYEFQLPIVNFPYDIIKFDTSLIVAYTSLTYDTSFAVIPPRTVYTEIRKVNLENMTFDELKSILQLFYEEERKSSFEFALYTGVDRILQFLGNPTLDIQTLWWPLVLFVLPLVVIIAYIRHRRKKTQVVLNVKKKTVQPATGRR